MIEVVQNPVFKQNYEFGGQLQVFEYNLLSAKSNVNLVLKSKQAKIESIGASGVNNNAVIRLDSDILSYLSNVQTQSGENPSIYIADESDVFPNYTGSYIVVNFFNVLNKTNLVVKRSNGNSSYQGDKTFLPSDNSQCLYRYQSYATIKYYNRNLSGNTRANIQILNTITQQFDSDGSLIVNLSESAKPYVPDTGCFAIQVVVSEYDFTGLIDSMTSDIFNFVDSSLQEGNYGNLTIFNPNGGGKLLPSTGWCLLYEENKINPFFINFVANEKIVDFSFNQIILIVNFYDIYNKKLLISEINLGTRAVIGLNTFDLSNIDSSFVQELNNIKPYKLGFKIKYNGSNFGEWAGNEFTNDFLTSDEFYSSTSDEYFVFCKFYKLDNLRDFYFSYNSGWGGISTFNAKMYIKTIEPEILQLRNQDKLSNYVVRSSEMYDITIKFQNLKQIAFLTGNDLTQSIKEDGIYESEEIIRYDQFGVKTNWLIQPQSYSHNNSDRFQDVTFTVIRPNFQNTITREEPFVEITGIESQDVSAKINCQITQIGIEPVLERGVLFNGVFIKNNQPVENYFVFLTGLLPNTSYEVKAQIVSPTSVILSTTQTFKTQE